MRQIEIEIGESAAAFRCLVVPHLQGLWPGGSIEIVEGVTDSTMAERFDMLCGIDAWVWRQEQGVWGIASRIQKGGTDWRSFTLRLCRPTGARTEYERLRYCMKRDALWPRFMIQAYTTGDYAQLLSFAVAQTRDVLACVEAGQCVERTNPQDGTRFAAVYWDVMLEAGCKLYEFGGSNGPD